MTQKHANSKSTTQLSRAEAAAYCGVVVSTLRWAEHVGSLSPSGHVGRTPYYLAEALDRWRRRTAQERKAHLKCLHTYTKRYQAKTLQILKRLDNAGGKC